MHRDVDVRGAIIIGFSLLIIIPSVCYFEGIKDPTNCMYRNDMIKVDIGSFRPMNVTVINLCSIHPVIGDRFMCYCDGGTCIAEYTCIVDEHARSILFAKGMLIAGVFMPIVVWVLRVITTYRGMEPV